MINVVQQIKFKKNATHFFYIYIYLYNVILFKYILIYLASVDWLFPDVAPPPELRRKVSSQTGHSQRFQDGGLLVSVLPGEFLILTF